MIIKCWSLLFDFPKYASLYHRCIMTVRCVTGGTPVSTHNSSTSKYIYYLFQVSKSAITKHNKPEAKVTEIFSFPVQRLKLGKSIFYKAWSCQVLWEGTHPLFSRSWWSPVILIPSGQFIWFACVVLELYCSPLCSLRS